MPPQIIGLCRFSYPAEGGFQVEHESLAERRAFLYAPERMEERFRHFECITLPSIRAQTDTDFAFAIVIGTDLPEVYIERLLALIEDMPQAALVPLEPGQQHRRAMQQVFNQIRGPELPPALEFRLDDDDAVAVDFVARLRRTARQAARFLDAQKFAAIDFGHGFLAECDARGVHLAEGTYPFFTAGLAMWVRAGEGRSIMNFSHHKMPQAMPAITLNTRHMMLRTHNTYNDSRFDGRARPVQKTLADAEGEALLRTRYGIDTDEVRRCFSG